MTAMILFLLVDVVFFCGRYAQKRIANSTFEKIEILKQIFHTKINVCAFAWPRGVALDFDRKNARTGSHHVSFFWGGWSAKFAWVSRSRFSYGNCMSFSINSFYRTTVPFRRALESGGQKRGFCVSFINGLAGVHKIRVTNFRVFCLQKPAWTFGPWCGNSAGNMALPHAYTHASTFFVPDVQSTQPTIRSA